MAPSCQICFESFIGGENIAATKCGHLSHYECLVTWISRSKSCPQCRTTCTPSDVFRLFFTFDNEITGTCLPSKTNTVQAQVKKEVDKRIKDLIERKQSTESTIKMLKDRYENELQVEQERKEKLLLELYRMESIVYASSNRFPWKFLLATGVVFVLLLIMRLLKA